MLFKIMAVLLGSQMTVNATLLSYEQFRYDSTNTTFVGLNEGAGWNGPWFATVTNSTVAGLADGSLLNGAYRSDADGDRGATGSDSVSPKRWFAVPLSLDIDQDYYFSFMILVGANAIRNHLEFFGTADAFIAGFREGSSGLKARLVGGDGTQKTTSDQYSTGTPYYIVGKIDANGPGTNDYMHMSVYTGGDTLPAGEPALWDLSTDGKELSGELNGILLCQNGGESSGLSTVFDEIRIGTTLASVTPDPFDVRRNTLIRQGYEFWADSLTNGVVCDATTNYPIRDNAWMSFCSFEMGFDANARAMLDLVMNAQITNSASPYYGNFRKNVDDSGVEDQNVAAFIVPTLVHIYNHYDLTSAQSNKLEQCLDMANQCILNLKDDIPLWYENIYFSMIDCLVALGDETSAYEFAQEYYDFALDFGLNEYGAHNYDIVQLAALQNAFFGATNPKLIDLLKKLVRYRWNLFVHEVHPVNWMITPTASRAKHSNGFSQNDSVLSALYLYFGDGALQPGQKPRIELLLKDECRLEPHITQAYHDRKTKRTEWQARFGRVDSHVFQAPDYSLATQSGRRSSLGIRNTTKEKLSNSTQEADIQLTFSNGDEARKGVRFRTTGYLMDSDTHDDDFNHHWITSVQKEDLAVVSFNHDAQGLSISNIYSEGGLAWIRGAVSNTFYINGAGWDGEETALSTDDCLTYSVENVYIGLRFLESDVIYINDPSNVVSAAKPILLERWDNTNVKLRSNLVLADSNISVTNSDCRMGYVIKMGSVADFLDHADFYSYMTNLTVSQSVSTSGIHTVTVSDGTDTLYLEEDLGRNVIRSRKVNGAEYDNGWLLSSRYVSHPILQLVPDEVSGTGGLTYPQWDVPSNQTVIVYHQAEDLSLMPPMAAVADNDASGGFYVATPEEGNGEAAGGILIPFTGEWNVSLLCKWGGGTSNSCSFKMNDDHIGYDRIKVADYIYGSYHWVDAGTYYLHRGAHVLNIGGKEAGSAVDCVRITHP